MQVEVRLLLTFKEKAPIDQNPFRLTIDEGSTVAQAITQIPISPSDAKVILLNGRYCNAEQQLTDGDQLTIFPPLEGG